MIDGSAAESAFERIVALALLTVFWVAFLCLGAGLALWTVTPADTSTVRLMTTGLIGLLAMPMLRVAATLTTAVRTRDSILLAATAIVAAILLALTLRDAAAFRGRPQPQRRADPAATPRAHSHSRMPFPDGQTASSWVS
jgi:hypothetical protein